MSISRVYSPTVPRALISAALATSLLGCGATRQPAGVSAVSAADPTALKSQTVSAGSIVSGQTYYVLNTCANKALDVAAGSPVNGTQVLTWDVAGVKNQQWKFEATGDGFYKLAAQHSGKLLEVAGGNAGNGSKIQQWQDANLAHQQWKVLDAGSGRVALAPRHAPGSRLDVYDSLTANGTIVHLYQAADVCAQRWVLEPVEGAARPQPAAGEAQEVQYSGPLVITATTPPTRVVGGVRHFSGNWESLDPDQPAVTVVTGEPVVIENCRVRSRGDGIRSRVGGGKLTVRNCQGYGLNPNTNPGVSKRSPGRFIDAQFVHTLIVENNFLEGNGGIYVNGYVGQNEGSIKIRFNRGKNMDGRFSDGAGGWLTSTGVAGDPNGKNYSVVQFVQLNKVKDVPDAEIAWNRVENEPGRSRVEDNINISESTGQPGRPIRVHDNLIRGAYAYPPTVAYSGGGIILGDGCVKNGTNAYQEAFDNTVLETSNHGMGVAHGKHLTIRNNTVLGASALSGQAGTNAGVFDAAIYLRDYCVRVVTKPGQPTQYISGGNHDPNTVVAYGNRVGWTFTTATNVAARWDLGVGKMREREDGALVDSGRAYSNDIVTDPAQEIPAAITAWENRVRANGYVVGPR